MSNQEEERTVSDLEEVCDGGHVAGTGTFSGIWHVFADLRDKWRMRAGEKETRADTRT